MAPRMATAAFGAAALLLAAGAVASGEQQQQQVEHEVWQASVLDCPAAAAAAAAAAAGAEEPEPSGPLQVLWVWVSPVDQLVLPSHYSIDRQAYDACIYHKEKPLNEKLVLFDAEDHFSVLENGSLRIDHVGWADRGLFKCLRMEIREERNQSLELVSVAENSTTLHLEPTYRSHIYYFSLLYGVCTAVGFLLLTLLCKLVYYLLETYGCCLCCCCCENQLPPKAKKVKKALDSIETYRQQQLDKLRENYTQQSDWIRENCAMQMERVRENYQSQVQNLKDFKQYGSAQISAVREQYFEQMQRIRDYSTSQLDRVHENYIFQRQRLRKFSAQNYLKMRETGKYTTKTLSKVMESLPPLYLDLSNCRQTDDDFDFPAEPVEFPHIVELERIDEVKETRNPILRVRDRYREASAEEGGSLYYTPSGTPLRDSASVNDISNRQKQSNSLKNTPSREPDPYRAVYACHKKSRSFSHFLPTKWFNASNEVGEAEIPSARCEASGSGRFKRQNVQAIVEHVNNSGDYIDISATPSASEGTGTNTASTSMTVMSPDRQGTVENLSDNDAITATPPTEETGLLADHMQEQATTLTATVVDLGEGVSEATVTMDNSNESNVNNVQ